MKTLQIIVIVLFFLNCKRKTIEFIYDSEIKFFTETDISPTHRINAKFYNWEKPSLVVYSNVDYCLHFFDYKTKVEYKKINLENLPNKKEVRAFQFINEEYIIISTQLNSEYYIINSSGKIEKSFNITPKKIPDFGNIAYGNFNDGANTIPIVNLKKKKQLIVYHSHFAPYYYLKKYDTFYVLDYSIKDSINVNLVNEIMFSEYYSNNEYTFRQLFPRICSNDNSYYVGFSSEENLKILKKNHKLENINLEKCNNTFFDSKYDTTRFDDITYSVDFSLKNGSYERIIYDSYRKLYYQICSHTTDEIIKWKNPYFRTTDYKEFSIQMYNSDFEFLSETIFPKNTYQLNAIIPVPEGILIDIGNENNQNHKTSILSYHLFKII